MKLIDVIDAFCGSCIFHKYRNILSIIKRIQSVLFQQEVCEAFVCGDRKLFCKLLWEAAYWSGRRVLYSALYSRELVYTHLNYASFLKRQTNAYKQHIVVLLLVQLTCVTLWFRQACPFSQESYIISVCSTCYRSCCPMTSPTVLAFKPLAHAASLIGDGCQCWDNHRGLSQ